MNPLIKIFLTCALAFVFLAGCSDDKKESNNVTLSFMAEQNIGKALSPGTLTIDTAKILVSRIKFDSQGDDDSMNFHSDPMIC